MTGESSTAAYNLEDEYIKLTLEEEDEGDITPGELAIASISLVDCFLTDRTINFTAMRDTLIPIWRPVKGVHVKELKDNLYIFQFFHEGGICW